MSISSMSTQKHIWKQIKIKPLIVNIKHYIFKRQVSEEAQIIIFLLHQWKPSKCDLEWHFCWKQLFFSLVCKKLCPWIIWHCERQYAWIDVLLHFVYDSTSKIPNSEVLFCFVSFKPFCMWLRQNTMWLTPTNFK